MVCLVVLPCPSALRSQYEAWLYQYFLFERSVSLVRLTCFADVQPSDLLTEIDGIPARILPTVDIRLGGDLFIDSPGDMDTAATALCGADNHARELHAHIRLRGYLNTILSSLYPTQQTFCRPHDVADFLTDMGKRLDLWYWNLPAHLRFPRRPAALLLATSGMTSRMVGVTLKPTGSFADQSRTS